MAEFKTLAHALEDRLASGTLNRPKRLDAVNLTMPGVIQAAVVGANLDHRAHDWGKEKSK